MAERLLRRRRSPLCYLQCIGGFAVVAERLPPHRRGPARSGVGFAPAHGKLASALGHEFHHHVTFPVQGRCARVHGEHGWSTDLIS